MKDPDFNINDFVVQDILAAHASLNRLGVAQEFEGQRFSLSQRVECLVQAIEAHKAAQAVMAKMMGKAA